MFSYSQQITPAVKSHFEAQISFLNDIGKTVVNFVQKFTGLNMQLAQAMIADATKAGHEILSTQKPVERLSATAAQAQPAVDRMRAYQQNFARIAAEAQVELSRCAEEHIPETSRTAKALAEEVVKVAAEETEKARHRQLEALNKAAEKNDTFRNDEFHAQNDENLHEISTDARSNGNGIARIITSQVDQASTKPGNQPHGNL